MESAARLSWLLRSRFITRLAIAFGLLAALAALHLWSVEFRSTSAGPTAPQCDFNYFPSLDIGCSRDPRIAPRR